MANQAQRGPERYRYTPLSEHVNQIRLLTLLPGVSTDPIHISLDIVELSTNDVLGFEALSYTWGSTENPASITVADKTGSGSLTVTRNLMEALQHLRLQDKSRVLWIDAICINQQDLAERSAQVKYMADIYTRAERVVVWLGPEADDSSVGLDLIETLSTHVEADWAQFVMKAKTNETHWADRAVFLPHDKSQATAITKLLERPWFERLWIVQEIWLAGPSAIVVCGYRSILWSAFRDALFCITQKYWSDSSFPVPSSRRHSVISNLCEVPAYREFEYLLGLTSKFKCQDPRDRIFALLSLLGSTDSMRLKPDYETSVSEIYKDAFLSFSEKRANLYLIRNCELRHRLNTLPTWVPDWSDSDRQAPFGLGYASAYVVPSYEVIHGNTLRVRGINTTSITKFVDHDFEVDFPTTTKAIMSDIQGILRRLEVTETEVEALSDTICLGYFSDYLHPENKYYPDRKESTDFMRSLIRDPKTSLDNIPKQISMYAATVRGWLGGRSLFRTDSGEFGLGPKCASIGDIVVVLLGCSSPMILRPQGRNTYLVVGSTYCSSIINGDALLGSLPKPFQFVQHILPDVGNTIPAFLNRETGEVTDQDPRMEPYPDEWIMDVQDEAKVLYRHTNKRTGEATHVDPRQTAEALERRGVSVSTFDLV